MNWVGSFETAQKQDISMTLFESANFKGFGIRLIHKKSSCLQLTSFSGDEFRIDEERIYLYKRKIHFKIELNRDNVRFFSKGEVFKFYFYPEHLEQINEGKLTFSGSGCCISDVHVI
jgi:hypothetical protein